MSIEHLELLGWVVEDKEWNRDDSVLSSHFESNKVWSSILHCSDRKLKISSDIRRILTSIISSKAS